MINFKHLNMKLPLRVVLSDYLVSPQSKSPMYEIQDAEGVLISIQLFNTKQEAIEYLKDNFPDIDYEVL